MRARLAILPLLAVVLLHACGDDSDSSGDSAVTTTADDTANTAAGGAADTTGAPSVSSASTGDATEDSVASSVNPEFAEWCSLSQELDTAFNTMPTSTDPEVDWAATMDLVEEIRAVSPPEIADDVAVAQALYAELEEQLVASDWDFDAAAEDFTTTPEMDAASDNLGTFTAENCGAGS